MIRHSPTPTTRVDVFAMTLRQHALAHESAEGRHGADGHGEDRLPDPWTERRHDHQEKNEVGKAEHHVPDAADEPVDEATDVADDHAKGAADAAANTDDGHRDQERDLRAVHDATEDVPAKGVGPQHVAGRPRREPPGEDVHRGGILHRQQIGGKRDEDE
jgi:hypothetical protein